MSRIARIVLTGVPYHITQRGNGRQKVFFDAADYRLYLDLLFQNAASAGLRLWAYCLMPNHVHLIAVPERQESMAGALSRTHANYARYFNLKGRSCGHVWQARFFSCPLDGPHLWRAMAYVERNPLRAGIVEDPGRYPWSSAAIHLTPSAPEVLDLRVWRTEYTHRQWGEVLRSSVEEEAFGRRLQEASRRGRPLGTAGFITSLERRVGRKLAVPPPGRPKKEKREGSGDQGEQLTLGTGV